MLGNFFELGLVEVDLFIFAEVDTEVDVVGEDEDSGNESVFSGGVARARDLEDEDMDNMIDDMIGNIEGKQR